MNQTDDTAPGCIVAARFRPARGFANPHVQTLLGGWLPVLRRPRTWRERRELPDGDFVDIDWLDCDPSKPWVLVLAGLVGSLDSPYALRLLKRLAAGGYRAGLLNYRGLSGTPNRLPTAYHAGFTADLNLVASQLADRYGPGAVVGFSMGGNLLLKWLGEVGGSAPVRAAVAISTPFRLAPAADSLCTGNARRYGRPLTAYLKRFALRKFAATPPPFPLPAFDELKTLRDFDDRITAPLHGFRDADDYYERASCFDYLRDIAVPTLIVNALDDPLIPCVTLPKANELSASTTLELSARGGHVGFVGRSRYATLRFWLNSRILAFLMQGRIESGLC